MPTLTINETGTINSVQFTNTLSATGSGLVEQSVSVAPAKVGSLTTRTDDNTGTLTMNSGHGITTGARIDIYWSGGVQRGVTVGTVSVDSVPFDLGVGDNLPADETAITAMVVTEEVFVVTGADVVALAMFSSIEGTFVLAASNDTEHLHKRVGGSAGAAQSYLWTDDRDPVNPIAGDSIAKVYFSHGSSTETATMRCMAIYE